MRFECVLDSFEVCVLSLTFDDVWCGFCLHVLKLRFEQQICVLVNPSRVVSAFWFYVSTALQNANARSAFWGS